MGNAKVIQFPKEKSTRKRLQDRVQEQKSALVVSLASVVLVAVFVNQWVVSKAEENGGLQGNRGLASYAPANSMKEVKWEHELAKQLSVDESSAAASALAEKPTLRDELIFGYLEGKYGMKVLQGRIRSLEFIDAQAGEQPLSISNKASFLNNFAAAFGVEFQEVSLKSNTEQEQVYNLIAADKTIVGEAHFALDESGRVLAVTIDQ
jgi:hypothetical protein